MDYVEMTLLVVFIIRNSWYCLLGTVSPDNSP